MQMQEFFIDIEKPEKIKLECYKQGQGEPLIFLRGTGSVLPTAMKPLIDLLSKDFTIYSFTYPGLGKSTSLSVWNNENLIKLLDEFANQLELKQFSTLGFSVGATISLLYKYQNPERIKKQVLISPATTPLKYSIPEGLLKVLHQNIQTALLGWKNKTRQPKTTKINSIENIKTILAVKNFLRTESRVKFVLDDKGTLVLIGEADKMINTKEEIESFRNFNRIQLKTYPNHGHQVANTNTEEVYHDIIRFLK